MQISIIIGVWIGMGMFETFGIYHGVELHAHFAGIVRF